MPADTAPSVEQKVVDLIGYTNQVVKQAAAADTAREKQAADCAALIPACVDALIKHERIDASEREKVAAALRSPTTAIQLLTKLAGHRNTAEQRLGTPHGETKTAAAAPSTSRESPTMRAATAKLFTDLGLPAPTE
jgi:hypothetical protein